METIKITTDNKISIIDLDFKSYKAIQEEIGGHLETVRTKRLLDYFKAPVIMLVDEEGIIKGLPFNAVASGFYGTDEHGQPIVGDCHHYLSTDRTMKATYIVTDVADWIAPKWLANRIGYKGVKFLYTFDDGKSVLKGVRIGDEVARIGDAIHFDGNRMSIERR